MQETTKYQISQWPEAREVGLELHINNWCSIRTHKLRITWFMGMQTTTKYQIGQLPASQEVEHKLYTNNWCSVKTTHQTTHKLRITSFIWM